MKVELSLSDEQLAELNAANERFRNEQIRVRTDTSLTRAQIMKERQQAAEARDQEFKEILTKAQYEKWMALKPAQNHQPHSRQKLSITMQEMKKELGLTDAQVKKIEMINKEMSDKFQQLRADSSATRKSRVKTIGVLRTERDAKLKKVMTEEQYVMFQEYEKRRITQRRRGGRPLIR